jgi:acetyltransferase-like isoleucine patch superfamily enzyme
MNFSENLVRQRVVQTKTRAARGGAEAYNLRIRHCLGSGRRPVIVHGSGEQKRNYIRRSVYSNKRSGRVVVGVHTVFGEDVCLLTGKHLGYDEAARSGQPLNVLPDAGRDIVIGRVCYIGSRAILIRPIKIGDFAIVGAGAVVTKDVAVGVFVGGVPARPVRAPAQP